MANLTQEQIAAKIAAVQKELDKIKDHRTPVSEAEFVLNTISMAQQGKHIEVLNAGENSIGSQDVSIKASDGGSKDAKRGKTSQEGRE